MYVSYQKRRNRERMRGAHASHELTLGDLYARLKDPSTPANVAAEAYMTLSNILDLPEAKRNEFDQKARQIRGR